MASDDEQRLTRVLTFPSRSPRPQGGDGDGPCTIELEVDGLLRNYRRFADYIRQTINLASNLLKVLPPNDTTNGPKLEQILTPAPRELVVIEETIAALESHRDEAS